MRFVSRLFSLVLISAVTFCAAHTIAPAARKGSKKKEAAAAPAVTIDRWLVLGPALHGLPIFHDASRGGFDLKKLLDESVLPELRPRPVEGTEVGWFSAEPLVWRARPAGRNGAVALEAPEGVDESHPAVAWLAAYVSTARWQKLELRLRGVHPRRAWLDGEALEIGEAPEEDDEPVKGTIRLTTGKHLLLIKTVMDASREGGWSIGASLAAPEAGQAPAVSWSLEAERDLELRDVLDPPQITSLAIAPNGGRIVASVSRTVPGTDESESWIEIRDSSDGRIRESWRGSVGARLVAWSPDGRFISYVTDAAGNESGKEASLYLYDRIEGRVRPLLERVSKLNGYLWSPTGEAIAYWTTVEAKKDERGVKRLEGLLDRWATHRDKQFLHLVRVPGGVRRPLTAGALSTAATGFSPDGKRLLFTRQVEDLERRPYTRTELWELDLERFTAVKLKDFAWLNGASYAPDGTRILVASHSAEFGDAGLDLPDGVIPNSYDGQLFIWDPRSSEVVAITHDFDPAVQDAAWSRNDGRIYLTAADRDFIRLYGYDPQHGRFSTIATGFDVFDRLQLAERAPIAVGTGSSVWEPQGLVAVDLGSGSSRSLAHPADDWFSPVRRGTVESWSFTASSGATIDGRVYLPPDFDPGATYPALVYYYGGVSPVDRRFGGRYPKEWWAAQGYVVYVLQPSGAVGFGQEFSAAHVNDWGRKTSEEVLEGTRKFLETHPYVDPERVGCIGASYGGFMTMLLSTQTDLFAAAVAHAGISSIASYWGEGYWGFLYGAVANADSFPWNRRDVYVEQSPLFRADRNRVPILLTHGASDTNVPVGESDAFYVALKLLGKEVEYIQVEGQDHWIMDHGKRGIWSVSILAWFDRWLKNQPEWWNDLYPGPDQPEGEESAAER